MLSKHYCSLTLLLRVSGTLDLVARSGDFFVGVLYLVGVGSDLPCRESPAQIGRVWNYAFQQHHMGMAVIKINDTSSATPHGDER